MDKRPKGGHHRWKILENFEENDCDAEALFDATVAPEVVVPALGPVLLTAATARSSPCLANSFQRM